MDGEFRPASKLSPRVQKELKDRGTDADIRQLVFRIHPPLAAREEIGGGGRFFKMLTRLRLVREVSQDEWGVWEWFHRRYGLHDKRSEVGGVQFDCKELKGEPCKFLLLHADVDDIKSLEELPCVAEIDFASVPPEKALVEAVTGEIEVTREEVSDHPTGLSLVKLAR